MCLEDMLEALGCIPIGPAGRLDEGLRYAHDAALDAAILDVNLGGEQSIAIAEALLARGIPFAFASGYAAAPEVGGAQAAPLIGKPYRESDVEAALTALLDPAD
ncbi:MAG: response regulator [Sphingomonas sp.]|nr:response regulator [Sphingomonas sp.]